MADVYATITSDQGAELASLVRRLPGMLAGRIPDEHGIAAGFRARIGFTALSLIAPNFNELGRGMSGADGDKWPPLSREYLAYGRRFGSGEESALKKAAGLGAAHQHAPGNKKGLLTAEQLKLWRRVYADRFAWYVMSMPDNDAKARAAAIAWIEVKKAGGKTKLEVYGQRQVQILVDTGYLRESLTPGFLQENGVDADYQKPPGKGGPEQVFDTSSGYQIVLGTNVKYAKYHHDGRRVPKRRLWPERFPEDWWRQILGAAVSGLARINALFNPGA